MCILFINSLSVKRQFPNGTSSLMWKVSQRGIEEEIAKGGRGGSKATEWRFALVPAVAMEESTLVISTKM